MSDGTFRDLKVWKKTHDLVLRVYLATQNFPREEKFGLMSQIRRASVSIAANIVEGYKRKGRREYHRFLEIAEGSLEETKYFLILSKDLGYIREINFLEMMQKADEVGRMLWGLKKSIHP